MLTPQERAELEERGAVNVRSKLESYGGGFRSTLNGFLNCGSPDRGDVEDWLAEAARKENAQQQATIRATLYWAKFAGCAGIIGVFVAIVGVGVTIWLAK